MGRAAHRHGFSFWKLSELTRSPVVKSKATSKCYIRSPFPDATCSKHHLVTSAPLVAITGKKKGAHSLSVLPTEALRKPYPVTGGNAPRGHVPFSGPDNEISQVSVGPLKLKRSKRLSCLRAVYQIPRDASMGHAATAKHTTGRPRPQHSLGSGVLAFRGDRASPVLIQHIR